MAAPVAPRWSGQTRGGYFGNWFFIQLVRRAGLRAAYAWLVVVAAYFTLLNREAYRNSIRYLLRVLGPQPCWKRPALVFCHFFAHGVTLLDRLAVITGRARMNFRCDGESVLKEHLDRGHGLLLVGAHVGNWELGSHLLGRLGKPVNLVVLERDEARVRALFESALEGRQFRLLTTDEHPLRSIPIVAALRRGEIVALHGDRSFGGADLAVPFLGSPAPFPVGAYLLAAFSGAPLFHVFVVRERFGHYHLLSFPPRIYGRELLRAGPEKLRPHVAEYAARLETVVRQHPFQWGNFYPFWDAPLPAGPRPAPDLAVEPAPQP